MPWIKFLSTKDRSADGCKKKIKKHQFIAIRSTATVKQFQNNQGIFIFNFREKEMRKESGLSLIESAIVLSLAAAVTAGVLYYYNSANQSKLVNDTVAQIQSVVSRLNAMFTSNPSAMPKGDDVNERNKVMEAVSELTGISLMTYTGGGKVLKNPMGYGIQFWGTGFRKYQIETQVKDIDTCTRLAVLDLGTVSYQGVAVYQGNTLKGYVSSVQDASRYCSEVDYNNNDGNPVKVRFSIKF
ncbi:hypothetical protein GWZ95_24585 [Escherichia coli]|nr:hypothetical protein [Escherichia coli]